MNLLDELAPEAGAFYVMDRAYIDFRGCYASRARGLSSSPGRKKNLDYTRRGVSRPVDKTTGLRSDQTIVAGVVLPPPDYPDTAAAH